MKIINKKFNREYEEIERFEAGISLYGSEAKSIKKGSIRLEDAFVKFIGDDLYLINADIPIYHFTTRQGYDPRRSRRLLLHKKELLRLKIKLSSGSKLTIAPVSCYNKGSFIKVEIALAKGRHDVEKRKLEKKRDIARNEEKEAKEWMKR